jgi:hypothetical protein
MTDRNKSHRDDDGLIVVTANLLSKIMSKMSEEGRVAICALLALPLAQYFHVDAQFSFWLTFVALGGYLSLRLLKMLPR